MEYTWDTVAELVGNTIALDNQKLKEHFISGREIIKHVYQDNLPQALNYAIVYLWLSNADKEDDISKIHEISYLELKKYGYIGGESVSESISLFGINKTLEKLKESQND